MAKKKIRDLNPAFSGGASTRFLEYKNLLINAVSIKGLKFNEERFVKSCLIENGAVGFDRLTDKWANVYGEGINDLGNPETLTFVFPNRSTYQRRAYYEPDEIGAYMILALPNTFALATMIRETVEIEAMCDKAIRQNLKACQTPYIVVVKDEDTRLSVLQAIQEKEEGDPVVIVSADISEGLKGVQTETPYMVDKFVAYRDQERDRLLNKLGIMSANINKRERVQVGEVNATVGQCVDYIYLLIDTFNKQMETYGLPFEMVLNESLEELYGNEETPVEGEETHIEGENKGGNEPIEEGEKEQ